jgi:hypothetical protein
MEAVWAGLDVVAEKNNFCTSRESNAGLPAHGLITILAELSRLLECSSYIVFTSTTLVACN